MEKGTQESGRSIDARQQQRRAYGTSKVKGKTIAVTGRGGP
jgi:hypothetical protein